MADNNANRKPKRRYSARMWDVLHYKQTEQYARAVDALFDAATKKIADAAAKIDSDAEKPFSFADYPAVRDVMQDVTKQLAVRVNKTIEAGARNEWNYACRKSDAFLASIMNTSKLPKSDLAEMQDRNLDALKTFQARKVSGLNLSERVWNYVGQYREQMETALDVGLGEGRSAQQLARDVKQNLKDPDRLFRRVRDKRGNLVLSKAAKAFHPGQGVYRSSVKNAQRLTRSEINMAYRESDWLRWQQLDFVVGFEVFRSNHEPLCKCDICAKLVGRYPKTFKFVGWHPQCMCYAVPILRDYYSQEASDDRVNRFKAALYGTEYRKYTPKNTVTDVPDGFKAWVKGHIDAQKKWASTPYFIRDNFKNGVLADGLKIALPTITPIATEQQRMVFPAMPKAEVELFKGNSPQEIKDFILKNIAESCTIDIKPKDIGLWNDVVNQLNNRIQTFGLSKFGDIGVPRNKSAAASWDSFGNRFNLNISALRNKTGMKVAMEYKKRGILYSFSYEDADDFVRSVIDHEIGHAILGKYANISDVTKLMSDTGKSIIVNGKNFNPINDVLGYYASTEEHEFFAEAFSFYMGKNQNRLDERIKGYFDKIFEKRGIKLDGNNASDISTVQQQLDSLQPQITQARAMASKWGLTLQRTMLEKYIGEKDIASIQSRIATIQDKAMQLQRADTDIRRKCAEWGISTDILDEAMITPDSSNIMAKMAELENRCLAEEKEYNDYISQAGQAIQEATKYGVDSMNVKNDLLKVSGGKREWGIGKSTIKNHLFDLLNAIQTAIGNNSNNNYDLDDVCNNLESLSVDFNEVQNLKNPLTDSDIIQRVGGGDMTAGSCSSLAFTYAANKAGLDVLDFRDGQSRNYFSKASNIFDIARKVGGIVEKGSNDFTMAHKLLKNVEAGKEYYFCCGQHAAIIRKTANRIEYLELQTQNANGFKPLNDDMLKYRFVAKKTHTLYGIKIESTTCLIDISRFFGNATFRKMMGYINTRQQDQRKGIKGTMK